MLDRLVSQLATLRVANIPIGESLLLATGNCLADIFLKTTYGLGNTVRIPSWLSGGVASWGFPYLLRATTLAGINTQERLTTIMFARWLDDTLKIEENVKGRVHAMLQGILGGKAVNIGASDEAEEVIYMNEEIPEIGYANESATGDENEMKPGSIENRLAQLINTF